jgi:predicted nucleic acid-binding protein
VAVTGLLDTNVALYLLGGRLAEPLPPGDYGISAITEMELLSYPSLTVKEEDHVRHFITHLMLCELTPTVRLRAVALRRAERLKLPDAIIGATALELGVELGTNDVRLARVSGLRCRSVRLT